VSTRAHAPTDAAEAGPELADLCVQAVSTAAWDLGLDPALFAGELAQGEIGLLIHYLHQAAAHVPDLELRERMEALVHRLTDWTESAEQA
jgi:hypothetical protein